MTSLQALINPGRLVAVVALCGVALTTSKAQAIDFERVVPPLEASTRTLADYLVQQAWANAPMRRSLESTVVREDEQINLARRSWMDQIGVNTNFSSQSQEFAFIGETYQGPGFNVGLSLNLGGITNRNAKVRLAESEALITRAKLDEQKPLLREQIMLTLETISTTRELLRIRRRAEVDAETNNSLVQSLYEQGKAQFQDVAQASEVYFQAVAATTVAKSNVDRAEIMLQTLTGSRHPRSRRPAGGSPSTKLLVLVKERREANLADAYEHQ